MISVKRIIYYQTVIKRHKEKLTRKTFDALREAPSSRVWIELLETDLETIYLNTFYEDVIKMLPANQFKRFVKNEIRFVAFKQLQTMKANHEKVKLIKQNLKITFKVTSSSAK